MRVPIITGVSSRDGTGKGYSPDKNANNKDAGMINALASGSDAGEFLETRPGMKLVADSGGINPYGVVSFSGRVLSVYDAENMETETIETSVYEITYPFKELFETNPELFDISAHGVESIGAVQVVPVVYNKVPPSGPTPSKVISTAIFESGEFVAFGPTNASWWAFNPVPFPQTRVYSASSAEAMFMFPLDDGFGSPAVGISYDGITFGLVPFTPGITAFESSNGRFPMAYGGGAIVISTPSKCCYSFDDGATWTTMASYTQVNGIAYLDGKFYGTADFNPVGSIFELDLTASNPSWNPIYDKGDFGHAGSLSTLTERIFPAGNRIVLNVSALYSPGGQSRPELFSFVPGESPKNIFSPPDGSGVFLSAKSDGAVHFNVVPHPLLGGQHLAVSCGSTNDGVAVAYDSRDIAPKNNRVDVANWLVFSSGGEVIQTMRRGNPAPTYSFIFAGVGAELTATSVVSEGVPPEGNFFDFAQSVI